jgi:parallel beta-helix repeat protein
MRLSTLIHTIAVIAATAATAWAQQGPSKINSCQTISQSGSYVVTKNLTAAGDCLVLTADYVTLDLSGFVIKGNGFGSGITASQPIKGVVIHDGVIIDFDSGIRFCAGPSTISGATNVTIHHIRANENAFGMRICGSDNTIKDSDASENSNEGILVDGDRSIVNGNIANRNGVFGIFMGPVAGGSTVIGNTADANGSIGVVIGPGSTVMNNTARENSYQGMQVNCPSNVLGNTLTANPVNIQTNGVGCLLDHNVIAP